MADRKATEDTSSGAMEPAGAPEQAKAGNEFPTVDPLSISPAPAEPVAAAVTETDLTVGDWSEQKTATVAAREIVAPAPANSPRLVLRPRHKRRALFAASVAIAAAFGAVIGAVMTGGFFGPAAVNAAGVEENKAMQQSVARLSKEITSLKANLEAANKSAHSQIAKINERLNSAEITGSITPPQTVSASAVPIPTPRPAPAGAETQPPARVSIVANWSIRDVRNGYVYVQGHGDVYQVVPGAPLPGLGPVEQIKRQDGRWVVVTPKGIIVSMRDRRYFEHF